MKTHPIPVTLSDAQKDALRPEPIAKGHQRFVFQFQGQLYDINAGVFIIEWPDGGRDVFSAVTEIWTREAPQAIAEEMADTPILVPR